MVTVLSFVVHSCIDLFRSNYSLPFLPLPSVLSPVWIVICFLYLSISSFSCYMYRSHSENVDGLDEKSASVKSEINVFVRSAITVFWLRLVGGRRWQEMNPTRRVGNYGGDAYIRRPTVSHCLPGNEFALPFAFLKFLSLVNSSSYLGSVRKACFLDTLTAGIESNTCEWTSLFRQTRLLLSDSWRCKCILSSKLSKTVLLCLSLCIWAQEMFCSQIKSQGS